MKKTAVLFGGSGFIGSYLALELLKENIADTIILADLIEPDFASYPSSLRDAFAEKTIQYVRLDVRNYDEFAQLPQAVDLVVNLAAVHREPGHDSYEYYQTNLPGAEHVCQWASAVDAQQMIFTSSISVYGSVEDFSAEPQSKSETTTPQPNTPYGFSKLAAERIHQEWLAAEPGRSLLIVRPGVIFGSGERGNVTRMVRAILGNYFLYTGNQSTRKAGGYVKELTRSIVWMYNKQQELGKQLLLYNFSMDPAPTVSEFATEIQTVSGRASKIRSLPYKLLLFLSHFTDIAARMVGRNSNINPVRVRKLLRSNYIIPDTLKQLGYQYKFNLRMSMEDWQKQNPGDWS